ncbi:putative adenylyltransferase/sulfurtransferase MoeZ [Nitrospina gracilis 3/211]|uniref:Molybdopterin-synthase adenylyltransferase n=1 Tax=Nitrospina gracilis (strain 3/211) TaxID=1266370 RepID=M1YUU8_NITG3|nr:MULTISPECIES: molybdopterin-synthase adenylyltransferase MoeB [Nitrospina]MCF8722591.1 adenylyltransferase/sulfurtransferase [Nitrospina sp. Nb-3]CCQ89271.1 putative adenylyltransferase/sulfurtransferase MoeZ [Nitrospina gracilis 3/211]
MSLTQDQINRYSRHLLLPEVGVEGQEKICNSKVLCIGTGGLGSPVSLYLAAAGVGTLGLIDFDVVDQSNLQRQIAHGESTVGVLKTESAKARIKDINSDVDVVVYNERLTSENALRIFQDWDVIVDGTDNFPTRYLANDACVLLDKPYVYGCILRFEGQVSVFNHADGPCYRCLYPEPPPPGLVPSCAEGGVLGVLCGIIGCLQTNEALKIILGKGDPMGGRLLIFDSLATKFREMKLRRDKNCPICGDNPTIKELIDYEQFCGIMPAAAEDEEADRAMEIEPTAVKAMLDAGKSFRFIDVRGEGERQICRIDAATMIPLDVIEERNPEKLNGLQKTDEIVIHCKSGVRSLKAAKALKSMGFDNVKSMRGGILEWSEKIDTSIPQY